MSQSCSDGKKMYKKTYWFFTFSLLSPSLHLKVLINEKSAVKGSARSDGKEERGKTLPFLPLPITPHALFGQASCVSSSACDSNRDVWGPVRYRAASSTGALFLLLPRTPVSPRRAWSQDKQAGEDEKYLYVSQSPTLSRVCENKKLSYLPVYGRSDTQKI